MNQRLKTTLVFVFLLTTIGTAIFAWQQHNMLLSLRGDSSSGDDYATLRKKLADAEHRAHSLQNELDALKARQTAENNADEPPPPPNDGDMPGPRGARFRGGPDGAFRELMNDPKVIALMTAREKQMLDQRYASLFKSLLQNDKLTPEQIEAFKNLLVERQNTLRDVRLSARDQGITDRSQIDQLVKNAQAELDSQIQNTLGTAGYADFQSYEKTYPQRSFVNQFAQSLSYTSSPLTDAQSQQLVDILVNSTSTGGNQRRNGGFGGPGGGMFGGGSVTITDATLTAAATVLDQNQMSALNQLKAQQDAQAQLRQALRNAQQNNATGGSAGSSTSTNSVPVTGTTTTKPKS